MPAGPAGWSILPVMDSHWRPVSRRDRDAAGRARNARPRDGPGRPLPPGSTGVQRQPEGVIRTPAQTIAEAQRLLDDGKPFHAHEVFEDAWKADADRRGEGSAEEPLWRGLAQLAVGLTHQARGNPVGAAALLRRGATTLSAAAAVGPGGPIHGLDLHTLIGWAEAAADDVDAGRSPAPMPRLQR